MSRHLVVTNDGPFLCNGSRDGTWTYQVDAATCVPCLRAALASERAAREAAEAERDALVQRLDATRHTANDLRAAESKVEALREALRDLLAAATTNVGATATADAVSRARALASPRTTPPEAARVEVTDRWGEVVATGELTVTPATPPATCPGSECPYCSGEACRTCGPDLGHAVTLGKREPCEHDAIDRHRAPRTTPPPTTTTTTEG